MVGTGSSITIKIEPERLYTTDEVRSFTGYKTAYLRELEKSGKIPPAQRDEKGWRMWKGSDVIKMFEYKEHAALYSVTSVSNKNKKKGKKAKEKANARG